MLGKQGENGGKKVSLSLSKTDLKSCVTLRQAQRDKSPSFGVITCAESLNVRAASP
jgi:hypothetical protein